jgi:hypothetical protein
MPSTPRRARSSSAPMTNRGSPQHMRRPPVGVRQASIGIRRTPSSNALGQVSQQPSPSMQRLNAPLTTLDEDHALGQVVSNSSKPVSSKVEPSRMRKVKSAIQMRIPFWGTPEKHTTEDANVDAYGNPRYNESAAYTSDMVDVLDTLGMLYTYACSTIQTDNIRSRGCYSHLPDQRPELAVHSQPSLAQSSTNLQPSPPP